MTTALSVINWNINWLFWVLFLFSSYPEKLLSSVSAAAAGSDLWSPIDSGSLAVPRSHENKQLVTMPSFDMSLPLNVTTQYGAHAHLVCRVHDVANKSVSWVRKKDGHLLTVDTDTFIGDGRFQVHHSANSDIWTLHLRAVRASDAGRYECQISSEPKLSLVYQLNIVVPQVEIRGAPDIYVMAGSGVALHCVISELIETPPYIFWYHKTERIAGSALEESRVYEGSKEVAALAFSGATKYGWNARVTRLGPDSLLAVLNVPPATPDFAGNYSCGPPNLQPASVALHVLNGEQPAAMQHGKNDGAAQLASWWNTAFVTLLFMMAAKWMSTTAIADEKADNQARPVDGNSKLNCSTDWTVLPISRGGNEVRLCWTQDVPSRCPTMTVSARSS